jgi:hypothetical protein
MNNTSEKWFIGLEDEEVLVIMSRLAHESVACYRQGQKEDSRKLYNEFNERLEGIVPYLTELKNFYYGMNKESYDRFDKLHLDILHIKRGMTQGLFYS